MNASAFVTLTIVPAAALPPLQLINPVIDTIPAASIIKAPPPFPPRLEVKAALPNAEVVIGMDASPLAPPDPNELASRG
jgi:hypothetical protein